MRRIDSAGEVWQHVRMKPEVVAACFGVVVGLGISAAIGYAIGKATRRAGPAGLWLGLLLGPLGWLLVLVMADNRRRCPTCKGALPDGTPARCRHCGATLTMAASMPQAVDPLAAWEEEERIRESVKRGLTLPRKPQEERAEDPE